MSFISNRIANRTENPVNDHSHPYADQAKVELDEVIDQVDEVKKLWNLVLLHPANEAD